MRSTHTALATTFFCPASISLSDQPLALSSPRLRCCVWNSCNKRFSEGSRGHEGGGGAHRQRVALRDGDGRDVLLHRGLVQLLLSVDGDGRGALLRQKPLFYQRDGKRKACDSSSSCATAVRLTSSTANAGLW